MLNKIEELNSRAYFRGSKEIFMKTLKNLGKMSKISRKCFPKKSPLSYKQIPPILKRDSEASCTKNALSKHSIAKYR